MSLLSTKPKFVTKNGKTKAVVLHIEDYKKLLEIAEDKEDIAEIRRIKKGEKLFRSIDDYLKKHV